MLADIIFYFGRKYKNPKYWQIKNNDTSIFQTYRQLCLLTNVSNYIFKNVSKYICFQNINNTYVSELLAIVLSQSDSSSNFPCVRNYNFQNDSN